MRSPNYREQRAQFPELGYMTIFVETLKIIPMSVLVEFAMFPTDQGESVSAHVSQIIETIRNTGVDHQLTPMGTVFETETMPEALDIVQQSYDVLDKSCDRVYATVKFDVRKGKSNRMKQKVKSIERKIGPVNH